MARPRGFHPRSGTSRRKTGWEEGPGGTAVASVSADSSAVLGSGIVALVDGLTLVRLRGIFSFTLDSAGSVGDGFFGAIGIGVTTVQAFTDIGITALPIPIDDMAWEGWLYHQFFSVHDGLDAGADGSGFQRVMVDSKAMRKVGSNEVIFAVHQSVEIGVAVGKIHFDSRALFKLP